MSGQVIKRVYASLPSIACQGLCHASCGPILYSKMEKQRMIARGIEPPQADETLTCKALINKRCSVYKDRPYVCRVWGLTEDMECPFGCKVERMIELEESMSHMRMLGLPEDSDMLRVKQRYGI